MHSAQASTTSVTSDSNCTLDIKPQIQSSGQQSAPKQREGTTTNNSTTNNSLNSNNQNNGTQLNGNGAGGGGGGGLFDTTPHQNSGQTNTSSSGNVGGISNNGLYNGYDTNNYGYHQTSGPFQTTGRPSISPHVKPQRTKARTSAGKTFRHGVGFYLYVLIFLFIIHYILFNIYFYIFYISLIVYFFNLLVLNTNE